MAKTPALVNTGKITISKHNATYSPKNGVSIIDGEGYSFITEKLWIENFTWGEADWLSMHPDGTINQKPFQEAQYVRHDGNKKLTTSELWNFR